MRTTSRGRGATRVVAIAALTTLLLTVTVFLVANATEAQAGSEPPVADSPETPVAGLSSVRAVASSAVGRAADAATLLADAATPPPPPPAYCPAPGSQFVDSWGFSRSGGRRHKGVDMMAPYGAPVIAPVDGFVRPSNSALGGIGFYLDDAAGNEYFGSHLASLDVTGFVEAGQQIGTVGSSGNAGTPHLHFEVKPAGSASVNPYPFALNWCTTDFAEDGAVVLLPGLPAES